MKNNWINKHEEHIENKLCYKVLIEKVQPKQETTLEEVANEYAKNRYSPEQGFPEEDYYISFLSFRAGAKWQKDKMYSEEEMLKILHKFGFDYTYNYRGEKTIYEWIPEWFEEYKRLEQLIK